MMPNLQRYRRVSQGFFVLLILAMPQLDILRYDVAEKTLFLFGGAWDTGLGEEFYRNPGAYGGGRVAVAFFLHAVLPWLVALGVFPLLGVFLGRAFCGWACPEGALFEIADHLSLKVMGRRSLYGARPNDPPAGDHPRWPYALLAALYLLTVPPLFGIMLSGYFIAPVRIWAELRALQPSFGLKAGVIGVSAYMVITFVFVRHAICKYLCGAGLMQMLLGWASPISLAVRFDASDFKRCTDCGECERVCFMDVRPRASRRDINCVNCGECVEACHRELGRGRGLFSFGRKPPGRDQRDQGG